MSAVAASRRAVASVLIVVTDPNIEALVGELVAYAGHRPVYDVTAGAAGESVRRARPEIVVVDTALPASVVNACLDAAREVGARPVLMSSTASASELAHQAQARGLLYFALPGGPRPLSKILDRALESSPPSEAPPETDRRGHPSVHPALCAALAGVARARAIALSTAVRRSYERSVHLMIYDERISAHRTQAAFRAAVTDYAKELQTANVPEERVVSLVHAAVADCANVVGAEAAMATLLGEAEQWARAAFNGA